jgi:hypothetical protein
LVVVLAGANALAGRGPDVLAQQFAATAPGTAPVRQIWGSSHASHGVDPRLLPGNWVNLAVDGGNPTYFRARYAAMARQHVRPAAVLLGLDATILVRRPWSRRPAQDCAYWPLADWLQALARPGGDTGTLLLQRFALTRKRAALQAALVGEAAAIAPAYRGFVPLPPGHPVPARAEGPDDPGFEADLLALLGQLRADGVPVVLFQAPTLAACAGETNPKLAAIARGFRLPFLDYNGDRRSPLNQDPTLFNDAHHLAGPGAERFSRVLAHDLEALNDAV